jgi:hypothetical protein
MTRICAVLLSVLCCFSIRAATITHDISNGPLIISGSSKDNYIIIGTTVTNYVIVQTGYKGVITLRNLNIELDGNYSPISVKGQNNCSNLTPVTNVDIILDGDNVLRYTGSGGCAAFHVEQGAQINISELFAVRPGAFSCETGTPNPHEPNTSGTLTAEVTSIAGGAGIGALNRLNNTDEATAVADIYGSKQFGAGKQRCRQIPYVYNHGTLIISAYSVIQRHRTIAEPGKRQAFFNAIHSRQIDNYRSVGLKIIQPVYFCCFYLKRSFIRYAGKQDRLYPFGPQNTVRRPCFVCFNVGHVFYSFAISIGMSIAFASIRG